MPWRCSGVALMAPAFALANRLARKLLQPSLERQVSYNAANERLVRGLVAEMQELRRTPERLSERSEQSRADIATLTPELQKFCEALFDSVPGGMHSGEDARS